MPHHIIIIQPFISAEVTGDDCLLVVIFDRLVFLWEIADCLDLMLGLFCLFWMKYLYFFFVSRLGFLIFSRLVLLLVGVILRWLVHTDIHRRWMHIIIMFVLWILLKTKILWLIPTIIRFLIIIVGLHPHYTHRLSWKYYQHIVHFVKSFHFHHQKLWQLYEYNRIQISSLQPNQFSLA